MIIAICLPILPLLCCSSRNTLASSLCSGRSVNHSVSVSRSPRVTRVTRCVLLSSARNVTCLHEHKSTYNFNHMEAQLNGLRSDGLKQAHQGFVMPWSNIQLSFLKMHAVC